MVRTNNGDVSITIVIEIFFFGIVEVRVCFEFLDEIFSLQ